MRWGGGTENEPSFSLGLPPAAGLLLSPGSLLALPGWVGSLFCAPTIPSLPASHSDHPVWAVAAWLPSPGHSEGRGQSDFSLTQHLGQSRHRSLGFAEWECLRNEDAWRGAASSWVILWCSLCRVRPAAPFHFPRLVQATQPRGCCRVQALWVRLGLLLSFLVQEQSG